MFFTECVTATQILKGLECNNAIVANDLQMSTGIGNHIPSVNTSVCLASYVFDHIC